MEDSVLIQKSASRKAKAELLKGPFFWLAAFYFIYCARPQDYISFLDYLPMAKITGILAAVSLILSAGRTQRKLKNLPKEASYLLYMILILFVSGFLSPVSRGDAIFNTIDFSKVYVAWILTFLLVTSLQRLRRIVFLQNASVAVISAAALLKGRGVPRLSGVIGGFYSNPNDLGFAIVLALPFCLAFLLGAKNTLAKIAWCLAILAMAYTLFLTASRGGFIDLVISGAVCLWHFGIKGKRHSLIVATVVLGALFLTVAGGPLLARFSDTSNQQGEAYESFEERKMLVERAIQATVYHPLLGIGAQNFTAYSGLWRNVHVSYLQIAAEGGIPSLIFYLMFFYRGFRNLKLLGRAENLPPEMTAMIGACRASLVGFVVGACFGPEAYEFFPYFAVCYTSVLVAMLEERKHSESPVTAALPRRRFTNAYMTPGRFHALYLAR